MRFSSMHSLPSMSYFLYTCRIHVYRMPPPKTICNWSYDMGFGIVVLDIHQSTEGIFSAIWRQLNTSDVDIKMACPILNKNASWAHGISHSFTLDRYTFRTDLYQGISIERGKNSIHSVSVLLDSVQHIITLTILVFSLALTNYR